MMFYATIKKNKKPPVALTVLIAGGECCFLFCHSIFFVNITTSILIIQVYNRALFFIMKKITTVLSLSFSQKDEDSGADLVCG